MDSLSDVPKRIKALRAVVGMSQNVFAYDNQFTKDRLGHWEAGRNMLPPAIALQFCDKYGVTTDWLYGGKTAGLDPDLAARLTAALKDFE